MKHSINLPSFVQKIYPNERFEISGTPAVLFRDHRWTLPLLVLAAEEGRLTLPVNIVSFDRHRDSLLTADRQKVLAAVDRDSLSFGESVALVESMLSPRDDDWIPAGMELGVIENVLQFGSAAGESDYICDCTEYFDRTGAPHTIFHLHRPARELSFKGALADSGHWAVKEGLWKMFGWDPAEGIFAGGQDVPVLDIDLDFFTFSWERYTFPFTAEIFHDEFLAPGQSEHSHSLCPAEMVKKLRRATPLITIASEPDFCGGVNNAQAILERMNETLFDGLIEIQDISVDYPAVYPSE